MVKVMAKTNTHKKSQQHQNTIFRIYPWPLEKGEHRCALHSSSNYD